MKTILFLTLILFTQLTFAVDNSWERMNPPGTTINYVGPGCPTGYLRMDGSAVSRTTYSKLFAFLGTANGGVGDGSTTFNLPNMNQITFTPTGTWTANTTYKGRITRIGDRAEIEYTLSLTGVPTASVLNLNMPTGMVVDSTKYADYAIVSNYAGEGYATDLGVLVYTATVTIGNTTLLTVNTAVASGTYTSYAPITSTAPFSWNTNDNLMVRAKVYISGWSPIYGNCIKY